MKMDKCNRLKIPLSLLEESGFDIKAAPIKVRLALVKSHFVLFKISDQTKDIEYHDVVSIDNKGRFTLKKFILEEFGLNDSIDFIVSALQEQIIIRWL